MIFYCKLFCKTLITKNRKDENDDSIFKEFYEIPFKWSPSFKLLFLASNTNTNNNDKILLDDLSDLNVNNIQINIYLKKYI